MAWRDQEDACAAITRLCTHRQTTGSICALLSSSWLTNAAADLRMRTRKDAHPNVRACVRADRKSVVSRHTEIGWPFAVRTNDCCSRNTFESCAACTCQPSPPPPTSQPRTQTHAQASNKGRAGQGGQVAGQGRAVCLVAELPLR